MNKKYENGNSKMLLDLSDIYILIAKNDFPFDKLTKQNYKGKSKIKGDISIKNYVLGYIWLCPWILDRETHKDYPYYFINFIDSRVSGLNIAEYMIEKFESTSETDRLLLPFEVMSGAEKYWKKYFQAKFNINNKYDLQEMINKYDIEKEVRWKYLMSVF